MYNAQKKVIIIIIITIIIKQKECHVKEFSLREDGNLWIYVQLIKIRIGMLSKCSSKPEFECQ